MIDASQLVMCFRAGVSALTPPENIFISTALGYKKKKHIQDIKYTFWTKVCGHLTTENHGDLFGVGAPLAAITGSTHLRKLVYSFWNMDYGDLCFFRHKSICSLTLMDMES